MSMETGRHQPLIEEATEETEERRRKTDAMEERRLETEFRGCEFSASIEPRSDGERESTLRQGIIWLVVGSFEGGAMLLCG
jgi:hypothetical protein